MNLKVLNDDGSITIHNINSSNLSQKSNKVDIISSTVKEKNALKIINNYNKNIKTVLFDDTNKIISTNINNLDFNKFNNYDFKMMFFTSGSTGNPIGALKNKNNLEEEVQVFTKLISEYNIKQVIVTVPFIHIYGTLIGLLYPFLNEIDIILKEYFLPHNLLEVIELSYFLL
jgi:acyl-CoA synthetase (AMP-forming)/AMP-acid ligase II